MSQIPQYDPPRLTEFGADLNSRVKGFFNFWKTYNEYNFKYINVLRNIIESGGNLGPFQYIASAGVITPLQAVQPVTGTVTIQTINAPAGFNQVSLLATDGFLLGVLGNIASAATVPAGAMVEIRLNLKNNLWYPQASSPGTVVTPPTAIYVPSGYIPAITLGQILLLHPVTDAFTIATNAVGSQGYCVTAPTLLATCSMRKNGTQFGTMQFAAAANVATFTVASPVAFAPGDVYSVIAPSPRDATFADLAFATRGVR